MTSKKQSFDQQRWNDKGSKRIQEIKENPEKYIINQAPIPSAHIDAFKRIFKILEPLEGKNILEVGCGFGKLSVYLSKRGGRVTGIDVGGNLIAAAECLAEANQVECKFEQCNVIDLPFHTASYDFIIGVSVLHHLSKEDFDTIIQNVILVKLADRIQNLEDIATSWAKKPEKIEKKLIETEKYLLPLAKEVNEEVYNYMKSEIYRIRETMTKSNITYKIDNALLEKV